MDMPQNANSEDLPDSEQPVVRFVSKGLLNKEAARLDGARNAGYLMRLLAQQVDFGRATTVQPIAAAPDYERIQQAAAQLRHQNRLDPDRRLNVIHLAKMLRRLRAVVIPVMWGSCGQAENTLQVYDPKNDLTWCYLNLDNTRHDLKAWMGCQLGHLVARQLRGGATDEFVECFARALLFPEADAREAYKELICVAHLGARYARLRKLAKEYFLPPQMLVAAMNDFALGRDLDRMEVKSISGSEAKYNSKFRWVSESLFPDKAPTARAFIREAEVALDTDFFEVLRKHLHTHGRSLGLVRNLLQVSVLEAQTILDELSERP
jgi:hypothetical protein